MKRLLIFVIASILSLVSQAAELTSYYPAPKGWKTEIIPFPLDFAAEINIDGSEELVFSPGMYNASKEDYFSYAFSWLVNTSANQATLTASQVEANLLHYYKGLYKAVAKSNKADVSISMKELDNGKWQYHGTITWVEPFVTKQLQTLFFKAHSVECPSQQRWYFIVSPQPETHLVWQQLGSVKERRCS